MKAKELRDKSDQELLGLLEERNVALRNFRMQMVTGQVDNVRAARNARKDIARIKTVQRQREIAATRKA